MHAVSCIGRRRCFLAQNPSSPEVHNTAISTHTDMRKIWCLEQPEWSGWVVTLGQEPWHLQHDWRHHIRAAVLLSTDVTPNFSSEVLSRWLPDGKWSVRLVGGSHRVQDSLSFQWRGKAAEVMLKSHSIISDNIEIVASVVLFLFTDLNRSSLQLSLPKVLLFPVYTKSFMLCSFTENSRRPNRIYYRICCLAYNYLLIALHDNKQPNR